MRTACILGRIRRRHAGCPCDQESSESEDGSSQSASCLAPAQMSMYQYLLRVPESLQQSSRHRPSVWPSKHVSSASAIYVLESVSASRYHPSEQQLFMIYQSKWATPAAALWILAVAAFGTSRVTQSWPSGCNPNEAVSNHTACRP